MGTGNCKLLVARTNASALIKICGRATFICSADFKTLVYRLREEQCRRFVLDLTECVIMDSTFLGILARFGLTLSSSPSESAGSVQILNPNERIVGLLKNLGVDHLFEMVSGAQPLAAQCATDVELTASADKREVTRTSLEAHQALIQANPENAIRFKDVIRFLAEDLKRQDEPPAGV
ncbi:MAG: STAS domain-containing protein [Verrucomicrobia bacterium]|nr:STAS domain-containing protein [Verrucomicrobiota bacterium]